MKERKNKHILQTDFHGDVNVGLYGSCSDKLCLIGEFLHQKYQQRLQEVLKVPVLPLTIAGTDFIGIFVAMNSRGILLPKIIFPHELEEVKKLGLKYAILDTKYTALGNLILANDKGAIISPLLKNQKKVIEETLQVPARVGEVAELKIVGSCGVATNKGCLLHRDALDDEMDLIEEVLKVEVDIGTVNFGSPYVKSGVLANSNGFVVGKMTTGPEIVRIDEALGFL